MRQSRTVKKGGIVKYGFYRWQSNNLLEWVGSWIWIVEPVDAAAAATIRIEDKEGNHLADAVRGEPTT